MTSKRDAVLEFFQNSQGEWYFYKNCEQLLAFLFFLSNFGIDLVGEKRLNNCLVQSLRSGPVMNFLKTTP